jgi:hypothetical protein
MLRSLLPLVLRRRRRKTSLGLVVYAVMEVDIGLVVLVANSRTPLSIRIMVAIMCIEVIIQKVT